MEIKTVFRVMVSMCAVVLFLAAPLVNVYAQAGKEPIKIGINVEFTGVLSETSMNTKQGYDLYLQEIGYQVAGRPIKVIEYDNKSDSKISLEITRKLIEMDKVHLLLYLTMSTGAMAGRADGEKAKVPMTVIGLGGAERVQLAGGEARDRALALLGSQDPRAHRLHQPFVQRVEEQLSGLGAPPPLQ